MKARIKRSLSLLLALAMTLSLLGGNAWAAELGREAEAAESVEAEPTEPEEAEQEEPAEPTQPAEEEEKETPAEPEKAEPAPKEEPTDTEKEEPKAEEPEETPSPTTMDTSSGTCGENLTWTLDDEGTLTISGTGAMYDYAWDDELPWNEEDYDVKAVVIEDGVTSIGEYAFYWCKSLTSVTIPKSVVSIGYSAFDGCDSLETVYYAGRKTDWSLVEIGWNNVKLEEAEIQCAEAETGTSLQECSVTVAEESYEYDGTAKEPKVTVTNGETTLTQDTDFMVRYQNNVKVGTATAVIVGVGNYYDIVEKNFKITPVMSGMCGDNVNWSITDNVLTISGTGPMADYEKSPWSDGSGYDDDDYDDDDYDYDEYDLDDEDQGEYDFDTVVIEDGVTHIGNYAFYGCDHVTKITIGKDVASIGEKALGSSNLVNITVSAENTAYSVTDGVLFNKNKTTLLLYPAKKRNASRSYTIPDSVTKIADRAFSGAWLKQVTWPEGLTEIGEYAFYESSLISVEIPKGVTQISEKAFGYCEYLEKVVIPEGVTSIGKGAFECGEMARDDLSVTIPRSVTKIEEMAFFGREGLKIHISDLEAWCTLDIGVDAIGIAFDGWSVTYELYLGEEAITDLVIPSGVTEVKDRFNCSNLISVTIPDSVTSIESGAFSGCENLTNVVLPSNLTSISDSLFYGCSSLPSITIPDSVTSIGEDAFSWCESLTNVTIPDSVTSIGEDAFSWCENLASVTIPDSVTSIGRYAFENCSSLTSITIPEGVTRIDYSTFEGCSRLTSITIPVSVTEIRWSAFSDCKRLREVNYAGSYEDWEEIQIEYGIEALEDAEIKFAKTVEGRTDIATCEINVTFNGEDDPTVTVTDGEKELEKDTDYELTYRHDEDSDEIIAVVIKGVDDYYGSKTIKAKQEESATATSGTCGAGLTWKVEDGVLTISGTGEMSWTGRNAPWEYLTFDSAIMEEGVTSIERYAFSDCSSLTSITIPNSVTSIGNWAFSDCSGLTSITIPASVTSIGNGAFSDCSGLTSITIPASVTSIGNGAFSDCISLTSITIPNSVTSIGSGAFENCSSLTNVTLPDSVTSIGYQAFYKCSSLTSITIPASVTSIDEYAFYYCNSLTNITIPANVTTIEEPATVFYGTRMDNIHVADGNTVYSSQDGVLFNKDGTTLLCYPHGRTDASYAVPEGVTSIGTYAFYSHENLQKLSMPEGVTTIAKYAFYGCKSLRALSVPKSMKTIEKYAFYESNLHKGNVYYAGTEEEWDQINIAKYDYGDACNMELFLATMHYGTEMAKEKSLSDCAITLEKTSYTYTGKALKPAVTVKDGDTTLASGKDYDVTYANNTDAGTAKVTITGKGDYTGTVTKEFIINKADQTVSVTIAASSITVGKTTQITASAKTTVSYKSSDTKVATVSDSGLVTGKAAGTATITVTAAATKNYNQAVKTVTVTVKNVSAKKISTCAVTLAKTSYTYTGKALKPAVTVKDGSTTLTSGKDYDVTYANNTNVGTAKVTITGKGDYTGSVTKTFTIKKAGNTITAFSVTKVTSTKAQSIKLNAKAKGSAKLTYKSDNKKVTVDKNGKVTIAKKFVGKATITISAAATKNYKAASKKVTVTVNPAGVKLSSVTNSAKKTMKVTWKKNSTVTGYQVQYSTSKSFKSPKTVTVKKAKTTSTTMKKLTKGKKYYVRVRTYQKVGSKTYYSAWSSSKNVTIKK